MKRKPARKVSNKKTVVSNSSARNNDMPGVGMMSGVFDGMTYGMSPLTMPFGLAADNQYNPLSLNRILCKPNCLCQENNVVMNKCNESIFKVILILTMLAATGCTSMVVKAGNRTYNHLRGDLLGIVPDKLPDVYTATITAVEKLSGFDMTEKELNSLNGHIIAYDDNARKVRVDLSRTEQDQTRVQIRIGMIGDKVESVMIYDHIKKYLPSSRSI